MLPNSSHSTAPRLALESVPHRRSLPVLSLTLMGLCSVASAAAVCLVVPRLGNPRASWFSLSSQALALDPDLLLPPEIVPGLALLGVASAAEETARAGLDPRLQHSLVPEFIGKKLFKVPTLEPGPRGRWGTRELASRTPGELQGSRVRLNLGAVQGIRGIAVATALASIASRVDSGLATRGPLVIRITTCLLALIPELGMEAKHAERGER